MKEQNKKAKEFKDYTKEEQERIHMTLADNLLQELYGIEYLEPNKIEVVLGKVKYKEPVESSIVGIDGKKSIEYVEKEGWKLQLLLKAHSAPEIIYQQVVEGLTYESRYHCILFSYKDMLNNGLRMFHLIHEDQKLVMHEMAKKKFEV